MMIEEIQNKKAFICDMDGVIYHGDQLVDGAVAFSRWLKANNKQFLFLTNSSARSPLQLQKKLADLGIETTESHFMTSALATASFLASQCPGGSVYVIGEQALSEAFCNAGLTISDRACDYVVVDRKSVV